MALTPLLVVGAMLAALPLVVLQGPAHTVPLDAVNLVFLAAYWGHVVARRARVEFPLLLPFWLLLLGSCGGLYSAIDLGEGVLTTAQDVYLYLWFVTLAHFLVHHCRSDVVVTLWALVASAVALLAVLGVHVGPLGAGLAGSQRAAATFREPNMCGNYLIVSFFLAWAAAAGGRRALYLILPLLAAGVHATGSNGALLGMMGGGAAVAVVRLSRERQRAAGVLLVGAALAIAILGVGWDQIETLGLRIASRERGAVGGGVLKGYQERAAIWADIVEIVREVPTGVGPGNLGKARGLRSGNYYSAHNEYLGMLGERGPLGLAGWCGILVGVGVWLWRWRPEEGGARLAAPSLWGLLAALVFHAGVIELSHFRHVWLAVAVVWTATHAPLVDRAGDTALAPGLQPALQEAS
jgi:O-antigen ligase